MKRSFLLLASVATVALSGCSNEEIANVETSMQNAIGFNVVGSNPGTRAVPTTPDNLTSTDFDVFAFETGNTDKEISPFMGNTVGTDGVQIVYKENSWVYNDPAELAYWPTTALDFYAVNPATSDLHTNSLFFWNIKSNSQTITYMAVDGLATTHSGVNHDVMYATAFNQTKANGKVKLTFKHALSQVLFKAKTESSSIKVQVRNVEIHNIKFSGTFTFPKQNVDVAQSNWTLRDITSLNKFHAIPEKAEGTKGIAVEVSGEQEAVWLSEQENTLMVLPQTLTKWATTPTSAVNKAQGDTDLQCYLSIECTIAQNGSLIVGEKGTDGILGTEDDVYGTIYIPFGAEWQPGYRYIYTLIFGGGYDDYGKPILTPIEFEPEVTPWTDEEIDSKFVTTD